MSVAGTFKHKSFLTISCKFGTTWGTLVRQAFDVNDTVIKCTVPPKNEPMGLVRRPYLLVPRASVRSLPYRKSCRAEPASRACRSEAVLSDSLG